jgi:hypothetical protein
MITLEEIEAAAASLPTAEKEKLLFFVAAQLRAEGGQTPSLRAFSKEEMASWIAEDEADMERFQRSA